MDLGRGQQCLQCNQCPGFFEHATWRKVCQHCRCPFEAHEISDSSMVKLVSDFQRHCGSASDNDSGCALEEYAWIPPGLKTEQVHEYFNCLPEEKIPFINSVGEQHRMRQVLWQCPPHDSDARFCHDLPDEEVKEHTKFNEICRKEAKGRGAVRTLPVTMQNGSCEKCGQEVKAGMLGVFAPRVSQKALWHPACFACAVCHETLVDLIYFHKQGEVYCGRHFAELHKPRCAACDEMIFADECTEAEERCWHMKHFACFQCDTQLGGQRYVMKDDKPYCCQCFEGCFSEFCDTCDEQIFVDQSQITHAGQRWHASKRCFKCYTCCKPLIGLPFLPKNGVTYCSKDCSLGLAVDSANDSLESSHNSKEDIQSLLRKTVTVDIHTFTNNNLPAPLLHKSVTKSNCTAVDSDRHSEGYGSLLNTNQNVQPKIVTTASKPACLPPRNVSAQVDEPIYENANRILSRSMSTESEPTRPARATTMSKSVTFATLHGVTNESSDEDDRVTNLIKRPIRQAASQRRNRIRRRAERDQRHARHELTTETLPGLPSCSEESSSDSDGDEEYERAVAKSRGLVLANPPLATHSSKGLKTKTSKQNCHIQ